jgi:hypothetical protein
MRTRHAATLVTAVVVLSACSVEVRGVASPASSPGPPSSTSAPAPSTAPSAAPSPAPQQPTGGTGDQAGGAQPGTPADPAGTVQVTGLHYESDNGSARLVVDMSGNGVPEWTVAYSRATGPNGAPVDIAGDAFLRVRVRTGGSGGARGSSRFSISPGPVAEARTLGVTDGYDEVLIGVRGGKQPFSVQALTDPGRLVLQVRAAS